MTEPQPEAPAEEDTETVTPEAETEAPQAPETPKPKPTETVDFWKAKAREQEKRAKENAEKATQFDALVAASKSREELAIERAEAAERKAAELESEKQIAAWKKDVAKATGVPADALRGTTLEEIEDHAATLKPLLPEPRKAGAVPAEGRTVTTGTGDPAQQFAELLRNARK